MKARILIVTAGAIAALTAGSAGAMIPVDGGSHLSSSGQTLHTVKATQSLKHQVKASATAIKLGAYNTHAYVQGGASNKVAKAITKAGQKITPEPPLPCICIPGPATPVPAPAMDPEQDCLINNICTDEQNCAIWGLNCNLVENPALAVGSGVTEQTKTDTPAG